MSPIIATPFKQSALTMSMMTTVVFCALERRTLVMRM